MNDPNTSHAPVLDMAQVNEIKQVMEEEFDELMQLFLEDTRSRLAKIENAFATDDPLSLRQAAHALKASSSNVGATRLAKLTLLLEEQSQHREPATLSPLLDQLRTTVMQTEYAVDALLHP